MAQLQQERDHVRHDATTHTFITCHYIFSQPTVSNYTFTTNITQIKSATQNYNYSEMWPKFFKV
jgi:hypothetical protein